jgi:hypothetical protein
MQSLVKSSYNLSCKDMQALTNSSSLSRALYIQSLTPLPHSLVMQHKSEGDRAVKESSIAVCYSTQWVKDSE